MASVKKVWLVTGASSGIGTEIALAALRAGHTVIGTARSPEKAAELHPEFQELGGQWLKLDVIDPKAQEIVAKAVQDAGRIDVLVNNSGSGYGCGLVEDAIMEDVEQALNVNVLGPLRCIKGVLPTMRAQKSGTIVNHGSVLGVTNTLGCAAYGMSKFALEALTESLQIELVDYNIRALYMVTGWFQTAFFGNGFQVAALPSEPYQNGKVGATWLSLAPSTDPKCSPGDPKKLAARLVEIVDGTGAGEGKDDNVLVPFGKESLWAMRRKALRYMRDAEAFEDMALSTDVDNYDESLRFWPNKVTDLLP